MTRYPALTGCLWLVAKVVIISVGLAVAGHFADDLVAYLILDRGWNAITVVENRGAIEMLVIVACVMWLVRDSGRHPKGENSRSEVEGEACQNGRRHRPPPIL